MMYKKILHQTHKESHNLRTHACTFTNCQDCTLELHIILKSVFATHKEQYTLCRNKCEETNDTVFPLPITSFISREQATL